MRSQPCLLILDIVENFLTSDRNGSHRFQDPAFTLFFDRLIQVENIPSRLILISQDQIPVMAEVRSPKPYPEAAVRAEPSLSVTDDSKSVVPGYALLQ